MKGIYSTMRLEFKLKRSFNMRHLACRSFLYGLTFMALVTMALETPSAYAQTVGISNSSFEIPVTSTGVQHPTGAGWGFTTGSGGFSGIAPASAFGQTAPNGSQVCYIQGTSSIGQTINGLVPGDSYLVTISAANRASYSVDPLSVTVGGNSLGVITPSSTSFTDFSFSFTATSTSEILGVAGTTAPTSPAAETNLDNARITYQSNSAVFGNFGFEYPVTSTGIQHPTGASWGFTTGSGGFSGIAPGTLVGTPAVEGNQVGYIQGTCSIGQTLTGLVSGVTYKLTFAAAGRSGYASDPINVKLNGNIIYTPNITNVGNFVDYSTTFTASSTTAVLSFVGTVSTGGETNLDNVRVTVNGTNMAFDASNTTLSFSSSASGRRLGWYNGQLELNDGVYVNCDQSPTYDPNPPYEQTNSPGAPITISTAAWSSVMLPTDHFHVSFTASTTPHADPLEKNFRPNSFHYGTGFTFTIRNYSAVTYGNNDLGTSMALPTFDKAIGIVYDSDVLYSHWNIPIGGGTTMWYNTPTDYFISGSVLTNNMSFAAGDPGDPIQVVIDYNNPTLHVLMTDTVTGMTNEETYSYDIPTYIGAATGYFGFTCQGSAQLPETATVLVSNINYQSW